MSMTVKDHELVPEALIDKDGLKVSKSPWGPDDEIGRLNWITPETNRAILEHLTAGTCSTSTSSTSSACRPGLPPEIRRTGSG